MQLRIGGTKHHVAHAKQLLNVAVVFSDPRFAQRHAHTGGTRARSVLVCPILSRRSGEVLGMLEVINKKWLTSRAGRWPAICIDKQHMHTRGTHTYIYT